MSTSHYIIRGGIEGRERLRLLARVMQPTTLQLLERAGVTEGMALPRIHVEFLELPTHVR